MFRRTKLSSHVRLMGNLLGHSIARAHGEHWLEKIEEIRMWGKAARNNNTEARQAMVDLFKEMSDQDLLIVARAFTQFLSLANIAEQSFTTFEEGKAAQETESYFDSLFERIKTENGKTDLKTALDQLQIDLVLTAHPTEASRRTIIHKYSELYQCIQSWDKDPTKNNRERIQQRVSELICQIWHTEEIRSQRPTPVDEAKWGFSVIEHSLWHAIPQFMRQLNQKLEKEGLELPIDAHPVNFFSWMGGDRDGNPFVTAKVTEEALLLARWQAADLFIQDTELLGAELSMSKCSDALRKVVGETDEPYRVMMKRLGSRLLEIRTNIEKRLKSNGATLESCILSRDELIEPLMLCHKSLNENGMPAINRGKLLDTIRRAHCFGPTLLRLDVRQNSDRHLELFSELTQFFGLGDYAEWSEDKKQEFLLNELNSNRPLIPNTWKPSDNVQEVIDTISTIARHSEESFGIYIISMAQQASDILAVQLLLQDLGVSWPIPVAPLFETLDDLDNALDIMTRLYKVDWYRDYIKGKQHVMIGYSDSAKDAGPLAASWAQYRAQESLINLSKENGIGLTLFHGRGGTIGRGGGPAHQAILSQPPGSVDGGFRVTEQGETIRFKFGMPAIAVQSLMLYTSAILEALILPPPEPKPEWRELMNKMADESCAIYRSFIREHENFVPYFCAATPEQELGKLPLGSRPSKRNPQGGIESLRAIPWIFAWSQNRLMLPSWLGSACALGKAMAAGENDKLHTMKEEWPFFETRFSMLEMVYMKTDAVIAEAYEARLVPEELKPLGEELRAMLGKDIQHLLSFIGHNELMCKDTWNKESILLREPYIEPLHWLQIELLDRNRKISDQPTLEKALMITIAGIAAGMRNTG